MSPEEYGRALAERAKPITDQQAEAAARILATVVRERELVKAA